jgi:hypothetical protein
MKIVDIIMYLILLAFVIFAAYIDKKDWECPDPFAPKEDCHGVGMNLWNTKPSEDDTPKELVEKINKAAKAEGGSVKWRRSLVMSALIVFVIFILIITPGSLPHWTKFYVSVLAAFAILYVQFSYYSYHRYKDGEDNIIEATGNLLDKCFK